LALRIRFGDWNQSKSTNQCKQIHEQEQTTAEQIEQQKLKEKDDISKDKSNHTSRTTALDPLESSLGKQNLEAEKAKSGSGSVKMKSRLKTDARQEQLQRWNL
jgi:hypothetical protein